MPIPPRASANVLGRANAIANAIVVSFMVVSFVVQIRDNRTDTIKFSFSAIEAAELFTSRRALLLQQSSSIADPSSSVSVGGVTTLRRTIRSYFRTAIRVKGASIRVSDCCAI